MKEARINSVQNGYVVEVRDDNVSWTKYVARDEESLGSLMTMIASGASPDELATVNYLNG